MVLRLLKNTFVSQKIESVYFCSCPQAKHCPRFLSLSLQNEITHFPQTMLFENLFFPAESRKDYEAEKMTKVKLVTGFDKPHHLCNLFSFLFCCTITEIQAKV